MASLLPLSITILSLLGNKHHSQCVSGKWALDRGGGWEVVVAGMIRVCHEHGLRKNLLHCRLPSVFAKDWLANIMKILGLQEADIYTGDLSRQKNYFTYPRWLWWGVGCAELCFPWTHGLWSWWHPQANTDSTMWLCQRKEKEDIWDTGILILLLVIISFLLLWQTITQKSNFGERVYLEYDSRVQSIIARKPQQELKQPAILHDVKSGQRTAPPSSLVGWLLLK